jgi:non-specific serine/threonine protein kinase
MAILRQHLGEEPFAQAWAEGRVMSLEQAADYALAITAPSEPLTRARSADPAASTAPPAPAEHATPDHHVEIARLSGREREVATLITRGLTNRRIAEQLHLSERTVDTHVRHILGKLELTSRAQIAAWTVERGLTTTHPT